MGASPWYAGTSIIGGCLHEVPNALIPDRPLSQSFVKLRYFLLHDREQDSKRNRHWRATFEYITANETPHKQQTLAWKRRDRCRAKGYPLYLAISLKRQIPNTRDFTFRQRHQQTDHQHSDQRKASTTKESSDFHGFFQGCRFYLDSDHEWIQPPAISKHSYNKNEVWGKKRDKKSGRFRGN